MLKDDKLDNKTKCGTLMSMDEILDIGLSDNLLEGVQSLGVVSVDDLPTAVQDLIDQREVARIARNWIEADTLRDAIKLKGYTLEDTNYGPKVTKE